jgi:integrating conjugative element protein (TIGR03757 family)
VWRLDERDAIAAELSRGLPADPQAAAMEARRRFVADRARIEARVKAAIAGLQRANELGVRRYPAIVFDGQAIVYGVTDLPNAIALYQARSGSRP